LFLLYLGGCEFLRYVIGEMTNENKKIVVVGSSNTDMIIKAPRIPKPGETVLGGQFSMAAGGKGAIQAVAAARAGGDVVFIARVGSDFFGERAIKSFNLDKIDSSRIVKDSVMPSGIALVFVDKVGQNSIAVAAGANAQLSRDDVEKSKDAIATAGILLMQLEIPMDTVLAAAQIADANHVRVILNPAPAQKLSLELLKYISILTPNEFEAEELTGIKISDNRSAESAADQLLAQGVETVLISLGQRGAFLATQDIRELVPGFSVRVVDNTGAGDVFCGALAVALSENKQMRDAVIFANAAAAISVTRLGAQPSIPRRREIERFLSDCSAGTANQSQ
jgi:ribokinase